MKLAETRVNIEKIFSNGIYEEYENLLKNGFEFFGFDFEYVKNNKDKFSCEIIEKSILLDFTANFDYKEEYLFSIIGKYENGVYKLELFTDDNMYNKIKKENKNEM